MEPPFLHASLTPLRQALLLSYSFTHCIKHSYLLSSCAKLPLLNPQAFLTAFTKGLNDLSDPFVHLHLMEQCIYVYDCLLSLAVVATFAQKYAKHCNHAHDR